MTIILIQIPVQRGSEMTLNEINIDPAYLASKRVLTASQVDDRTHARTQHDLTPEQRLESLPLHAEYGAARH